MAQKIGSDLDFQSAARCLNLPAPVADAEAARKIDLGVVPLFSSTFSTASAMTADNIFDASLYSHYGISFRCRPATDNVSLRIAIRSATPSTIVDFSCATRWNRLDASGAGDNAVSGNVVTAVGNATGEGNVGTGMVFRPGSSLQPHHLSGQVLSVIFNGTAYSYGVSGYAVSGTTVAGITIYYSTGNVADGELNIVGVPK